MSDYDPPVKINFPDKRANVVYDQLFEIYKHCHDYSGREVLEVMKRLKK